jgi:UV DNA damage endonuclease
MRLGFAVKVVARSDLKSHDTRRWQNEPHLRVSLGYLDAILDHVRVHDLHMYRISSQIAPYVTHPDMPRFHGQLEECAEELARIGARARELDIRLSMHPSQYIVLNAPDEAVARAAVRDLDYHARFLDALGAGPEAVVVIHGGGLYGDPVAAEDRWVARYETLSEAVRRRLVLENDERSFPLTAVLRISARTGVPVVLDTLHHAVLDPDGIPIREASARAMATWPPGVVPKIHFSSPRAEAREIIRRDRSTGERRVHITDPLAWQHADLIDPDEFLSLLQETEGLRYDVMVEAKQKDVAVLKLRADLQGRGVSLDERAPVLFAPS